MWQDTYSRRVYNSIAYIRLAAIRIPRRVDARQTSGRNWLGTGDQVDSIRSHLTRCKEKASSETFEWSATIMKSAATVKPDWWSYTSAYRIKARPDNGRRRGSAGSSFLSSYRCLSLLLRPLRCTFALLYAFRSRLGRHHRLNGRSVVKPRYDRHFAVDLEKDILD